MDPLFLHFRLFLLFLDSIWPRSKSKLKTFKSEKQVILAILVKITIEIANFSLIFLRTGIKKLLEISILCHLEFPSFPRFRSFNLCSKGKDN